MALPLFAFTLFVSAFLLFLVQPLIGKMILPKLGGTPQVWNTCMLFFQMALLAGYGYTHTSSTKLPLRRQITVHAILLFLPFLFLLPSPFNIAGWIPPAGSNPIFATLLLLAFVVGVPFFVVSTSAPLLQKWFANTGHPTANDPYFLYGASNLGSLLSLICYPFLIEPYVPLRYQATVWTVAYVFLGAMIFACAAFVWKSPALRAAGGPELDLPPLGEIPQPSPEPPTQQPTTAVKAGPAPSTARVGISRKKGAKHVPFRPTVQTPSVAVPARPDLSRPSTAAVDWTRRLRWVLLAFAPSSLMLGVTSYVSVDLSPFPLLWVIPLALYLLSFILVFSRFTFPVLAIILGIMGYMIILLPGSYMLSTDLFFNYALPLLFYFVLPALFVTLIVSIFLHPRANIPWVSTPHDVMVFAGLLAIIVLFLVLLQGGFNPFSSTMMTFAGFFLVTMVCHGELAKDRPTTQHLTEFFLLMSVGGALGGLFNAMIAPQIFVGVAEYPIAIAAACFLRPSPKKDGWFDELLVNAFPSLGTWVRETGDKVSESMGKPAPRNNWLLNYSLDILLAIFVFALTLWIRSSARNSWGWYANSGNGLITLMKFFGFSERTALDVYPRVIQIAIYGPSIMFCLMFGFGRAFRFGLSMCALMAVALMMTGQSDKVIYAGRSYFGVLRVLEDTERLMYADREGGVKFLDPDLRPKDDKGKDVIDTTYTYLMHGTTYHGRNYHEPAPLRRVLTTYYHQKGPVGVVMDRYRWFGGPHGSFYADARLPVSLIGLGTSALGVGNLPLEQLTSVWTEPPYATIGLGSGTMAGYGRAFQHVTYYEIDDNIRNFSLPPKLNGDAPNPRFLWKGKDPFFTYLADAIGRGSNLEVIMGDARLSMAQERPEASALYTMPKDKTEFYAKRPSPEGMFANRDNYYKVIVVDAFSSDAIPIHLITKEAIQLYFSKLAPDGVLCVHTSNRHMNLVAPVSDIAKDLGKFALVGHDVGRRETPPFLGHFGSEYVMLANEAKYLPYEGKDKTVLLDQAGNHTQQWEIPVPPNMPVWTDDFSNIVSILR